MKIGHNKEAKGDGDDAEEFDVVVGVDAVGDVVADLLVKNNTGAAGSENDEANNKSAKAKSHGYIITKNHLV